MGRVDRVGYVIAAILVLASVFAGEVLSFVWLIYRSIGRVDIPLAYQDYMNIMTNNPRNLIVTAIFALVGAWIGVSSLSRMEKDTKVETIR